MCSRCCLSPTDLFLVSVSIFKCFSCKIFSFLSCVPFRIEHSLRIIIIAHLFDFVNRKKRRFGTFVRLDFRFVWYLCQSDPLFVGEWFPLPFSLSMCAAQFMKPQVSIREWQDSIHAAGNSFLISHSSFIFHFQFSIIHNPPVTASPCHPPLGKEGFFGSLA